jgi:hypothetical protein
MSEKTSLADELTGKTGVTSDHGGLGFGDLVVLILDAVLMIYTAWRSYDFLTTTMPNGFQILAGVGLWGLDIGAVAWSLVWIFGSTETYQDWTAMSFFIIDLIGVVLTSLTDSLMYGDKGGAMTGMLSGIAVVAIPLVVVMNVVGGFVYHLTSPETKARRASRKAVAEHKKKMEEVAEMDRDLLYSENYILAKQDTLEKAMLLAEIKTAQDALEKATRAKLRDQIGVSNSASSMKSEDEKANSHLNEMRQRLTDLKAKLGIPAEESTRSAPSPIPNWIECKGSFHAWANATNTEPSPDAFCACGKVKWADRHSFGQNDPSPEAVKSNGHSGGGNPNPS